MFEKAFEKVHGDYIRTSIIRSQSFSNTKFENRATRVITIQLWLKEPYLKEN